MVLRQLGKGSVGNMFFFRVEYFHTIILLFTDAAEKEAKVKESVERAKEAVALDVKDGTSWSKPLSAVQ